jgi:hypothetical protein
MPQGEVTLLVGFVVGFSLGVGAVLTTLYMFEKWMGGDDGD